MHFWREYAHVFERCRNCRVRTTHERQLRFYGQFKILYSAVYPILWPRMTLRKEPQMRHAPRAGQTGS